MPELPEVETVVCDLRPMLVGRKIVSVRAGRKKLRRPWQRRWEKEVARKAIVSIERRGKWIVITLTGQRYLLCHLGMTGQLGIKPATMRSDPHTHLVFALDNGSELRFCDVRRFGSTEFLQSTETLQARFRETMLGPEPFAVDSKWLCERLARTRRCLKAILLDQRVLAGVGNIYADESLFEAKLHPGRVGHQVTRAEAGRLHVAVQRVLKRAIDRRGSSIRNYVDGNGKRGGYQDEFRVYGRTGEPCQRCRTPLEMTRLAGRSSHYCPRCQK